MKTVRLIIKGKVQGVFFRASAKEVADGLGVKGTVSNLENGDVELFATGQDQIIQKMIEWCWKGSKGGRVENVIIEDVPYRPFVDFRITRVRGY